MRLFRKLKDYIRTMMGVRVKRQLAPAQGKPSLGSSIVKDRFRIRVKYPINDEVWRWLSEAGWRTMPVNNNRRNYAIIPDKFFERWLTAEPERRGELMARLTEGRKNRRH